VVANRAAQHRVLGFDSVEDCPDGYRRENLDGHFAAGNLRERSQVEGEFDANHTSLLAVIPSLRGISNLPPGKSPKIPRKLGMTNLIFT
jgi:hypothetical protein